MSPTKTKFGPALGFVLGALAIGALLFATQSRATVESSPATEKVKKTTDVSFEDVLVQGKYHFSDEAVTTVEDDKVLDSLLGVRKDFKDRIKKSVSRQ